jgi:O-antigen ligase
MNQGTATIGVRGAGAPRARRGGRPSAKAANAPVAWRESLDPVRLGLFGTMLINISAIQMYVPGLILIRPALLCLAMSVIGLALKPSLGEWSNFKQAWPAKAVLAILFIACCSALFGISLGGSARYIVNVYIRNLAFFYLMILAIRNSRDLVVLVWSFVGSVGVFVFMGQTMLSMESIVSGESRLSGGHGIFDANDLGMILLMALPLAILLYRNSGTVGKIVSGLITFGIPVTVSMTGSRGALIGLCFLALPLFLALNHIGVIKRIVVLGIVTAGLFIGAPPGYWDRMATLLNPTEDENYVDDYGRLNIAKRGVGYMLRYPIFGVGVTNFARAEGTISPILRERQRRDVAIQWIAPHNTYVEVGAEMGMIALGIWLSLMWGGTIGLLRLRSRLPKTWETDSPERRFLRQACLYLPVSFLGFIIPSFFLSHAYTMVFYIPVAFLGGVLVLIKRELGEGPQTAPAGGRRARGPRRVGLHQPRIPGGRPVPGPRQVAR